MITFLRSGALWALPLAGIPFFVHVWGRVRARPTPFTALDLLREAAQARFSVEQFRRWLLLAVRALLLIFLILFLARPGLRGVLGGRQGRGVIVLDASYSLGAVQSGESAFDRARRIARGVIQSGQSGDRWGLIVFSDRVETALSPEEEPAKINHALESARLTFRGTSYAVGLGAAGKMVKEGDSVLLLSDLAAHGVSHEPLSWNPRIPVAAVEVVSPRANGAITAMAPGGAGGNTRVDFHQWGDPVGRTWALRRGGKWSARGALAPGGTSLLLSDFPAENAGAEGELILNADGLPTDDQWFFVSDADKPFTVCVVNGAPSLSPVGDETYFIRPVLDTLSVAGVKTVGASVGDLATKSLSDNQVILLLNPPPLSAAAVENLTRFVSAGGGLWVTAGDRGGAPSLKDLLPLTQPRTEEINEGLAWSGGTDLSDLKELLWDRVRVDRALLGDVRPGAHVFLRTVHTNKPVLSAQPFGLGRVACWGSTVDRDWTNLPAKPAFPLIVGHLLPWLSGNRGKENQRAYFVGDAIERSGDESRPLSIFRPDGKIDQMDWVRGLWRYDRTDQPGFYGVRGANEEKVAVNVRAEQEGNLARLTPDQLKFFLGGAPLHWISAEKSGAEDIQNVLGGRDLTPPVAGGIFVLLLVETILLFYKTKWKKK